MNPTAFSLALGILVFVFCFSCAGVGWALALLMGTCAMFAMSASWAARGVTNQRAR
jgi:hypothetical protein